MLYFRTRAVQTEVRKVNCFKSLSVIPQRELAGKADAACILQIQELVLEDKFCPSLCAEEASLLGF